MSKLFRPAYHWVAGMLSPSGRKARLSILIYHRVLTATDPIFPYEATVDTFDTQMQLLKSMFNVLPLPEAVIRLREGTLPARSAAITFDDGYADNVTNALPILKKHGLHATFFIATSYLNGGRMFNDTVIESIRSSSRQTLDLSELGLGNYALTSHKAKARAIEHILPKVKYLPTDIRNEVVATIASSATDKPLPNDLMMSTKQLKSLHQSGMEIGGHTHHHPILASLGQDDVRAEINAGKTWLEENLETRIRMFAYPNGKAGTDYLPEQARIVRELGFDAAVSTNPGISTSESDCYQLSRFTPWASTNSGYLVQLLRNMRTPPLANGSLPEHD